MEQRVRARYRIETPLPAEQAAEAVAGEQSTGTFTRIPGETDELRERSGARVESVTDAGDSASVIELSWPLEYGAVAAHRALHGRRESVGVEAIHRATAARSRVASRIPGSLLWARLEFVPGMIRGPPMVPPGFM